MISYDHVTKIFGVGKSAFTALEDVTFEIEKGHLVVFLGPSGCGKTTIMRMTNRLESITRGSVTVNGRDVQEMNPVELRRGMGYVIQQIGLFPNKTIAENVAVVPRLLGWKKKRISERVDELLAMVRLDPAVYRERYPVELSGGQQQRVGVARALAADPEILLMDEPFGAIDPINRDQIQDEFLRLQANLRKTIAFVSHDIHEAIKMADKIAIFTQGKLVQYDTPEGILTRPRNKFVSDFVGADRALKVLGLIRADEAMDKTPKSVVQAGLPAPEALALLEDLGKDSAIVVAQGKPQGYVTRKLLKYEQGPAGDVAEDFPTVVGDRDVLRDVLSDMLMHDMSVYPVVDEQGDFAGVIGYHHIQRHILDVYAEDEEEG